MAKYLILAFDGGGVRGYITVSVLQKLLGEPGVGDFLPRVNLRAGTSTGSFIALALAHGAGVGDILKLYQQASIQQIFTRNPAIVGDAAADAHQFLSRIRAELHKAWHAVTKYFEELVYAQFTNAGVAQAAQSLLGPTTKLSELAPVVVNTLVLEDPSTRPNAWMPRTLNNLHGSPFASMYAWEAALCSGAAPIYFPPYRPQSLPLGYCADGGLFANNPSMTAVVAALVQGVPLHDIYLLSFDTGTTYESMPAAVVDEDGPLHMGPLAWMSPRARSAGSETAPKFPLLSALMDASAAEIATGAKVLLGPRCMRVSVPLTCSVELDDSSDAAYTAMNTCLASFYSSPAYAAVVAWLQANVPPA